jgi:membrane protease YdiL (CAAX protease family)
MTRTRSTADEKFPVWGFAATLAWGVLIAAVFIFTQLAVMAVYLGIAHGELPQSEYELLLVEAQYNGVIISLSTIATMFICGLLIVIAVRLRKGSNTRDYLGLYYPDRAAMRFWLIIIAVLVVASDLLTAFLGRPVVPEFVSQMYQTTQPIWLLWIAFIIAAPVFEELFFRGFLFKGFAESFPGPVGAVVITAAVWAAIHTQYDWYGLVTVFVLGLVLGYARYRSGSLLLTIAIHSLINLIATMEAALLSG